MFSLKDFGGFYIGGMSMQIVGQPIQKVLRNDHTTTDVDFNGEYSNGAMYVQYYKPSVSDGVYLLIHGGGMSGAVWENAQFSSQSWLKNLLALNKTVYIIDLVGTGRSGYCPFDVRLSCQKAELRSKERTWTHFRFGNLEGYTKKNTYPESQSSYDIFEDLVKQNIPRWNNYVEPSVEAIQQLLKRESEWHIIAHSQGADVAMRLLGEHKVKDILLIEPAAFPSLKDNVNHINKAVSFLYGDYIDEEHSPFWSELLRKAKTYMGVLTSAGIATKELHLPDIGIHGNTHVPMCDRNSQEVFLQAMTLMAEKNIVQLTASS